MTEKQIKSCKVMFAAMIAASSISETFSKAYGGKVDPKIKQVKKLSKEALKILNKIKPDSSSQLDSRITVLMVNMDMAVAQPHKSSPKFQKGGVIYMK